MGGDYCSPGLQDFDTPPAVMEIAYWRGILTDQSAGLWQLGALNA